MEERNLAIWDTAKNAYCLDETPYKKLGSFESEIWEVEKQGDPFILRITDPDHRNKEHLESEATWIQYLAKHGVEVVLPIKNQSNDYVSVCQNPTFFLMLFSKAKGRLPSLDDITDAFTNYWGAIMGKMHRLAFRFKPTLDFKRSTIILSFQKYWDKVSDRADRSIADQFHSIMYTISRFPQSRSYYGVIHYDLHMRNFFIHENRMTIFDFDDMQFGWFVYDIAVSLYYWLWMVDIQQPEMQNNHEYRTNLAIHFLQNFLRGYQMEFPLPDDWTDMIQVFIAIRQMELYLVFEDRFGLLEDKSSRLYLQTLELKQSILDRKPPVPDKVFDKKLYSLIV